MVGPSRHVGRNPPKASDVRKGFDRTSNNPHRPGQESIGPRLKSYPPYLLGIKRPTQESVHVILFVSYQESVPNDWFWTLDADESRSMQVIEPFSEHSIAVPGESRGPANPLRVGVVVPHRHRSHGRIPRIGHQFLIIFSHHRPRVSCRAVSRSG